MILVSWAAVMVAAVALALAVVCMSLLLVMLVRTGVAVPGRRSCSLSSYMDGYVIPPELVTTHSTRDPMAS